MTIITKEHAMRILNSDMIVNITNKHYPIYHTLFTNIKLQTGGRIVIDNNLTHSIIIYKYYTK